MPKVHAASMHILAEVSYTLVNYYTPESRNITHEIKLHSSFIITLLTGDHSPKLLNRTLVQYFPWCTCCSAVFCVIY